MDATTPAAGVSFSTLATYLLAGVVVLSIVLSILLIVSIVLVIRLYKTRVSYTAEILSEEKLEEARPAPDRSPRVSQRQSSKVKPPADLKCIVEDNRVSVQHNDIPVEDLQVHVDGMDAAAFQAEFRTLPKGLTSSCTVADKPENSNKNMYINIKPYDHSRVVLDTIKDDPHSDYINACYIDGYKKPKAYIAMQGATKYTIGDIWRLMIQVQSNRLVLLTNLVEGTVRKSHKYWPDKGSGVYGDIIVSMVKSETFADFAIRYFEIKFEETVHKVRQFHFLSWPDHGVPKLYSSVWQFHMKLRSFDSDSTGPLVVQCSAGVGRTGTLLALDSLLEQATQENQVNIYNCIKGFRKARPNMVQTPIQYIFVHNVLLEALEMRNLSIPFNSFPEEYMKMKIPSQGDEPMSLQEQFQSLESWTQALAEADASEESDEEDEEEEEQKMPRNSVLLKTKIEGQRGHICAIHVDSYCRKQAYLVTKEPTLSTALDFWRMVYDYKSRTVVMFGNPSNQGSTSPYWPTPEVAMAVGPWQLKYIDAQESSEGLITRSFQICNTSDPEADAWHVNQFEVVNREDMALSPTILLELIDLATKWQQRATTQGPITVHCRDGFSQSGLFCVVNSVLEKMKFEQEVNVFHTVQKVRLQLPEAISDLEQYTLCYETALECMEKMGLNTNNLQENGSSHLFAESK